MKLADRIRLYGREKYVLPAREKKLSRFSIRTGEVVREMGIGWSRTPAVCSALRTTQFLRDNRLRLVDVSGPKSRQTTTVTYTYAFAGHEEPSETQGDAWSRLRGALKDIFQEYGGGEAYLRQERENFYPPELKAADGNK